MPAIKLQTKLAHKKLTSITVNGHTYPVDSDCCIVVDNEADAKKLLSLGDEWTDKVAVGIRAKPARAPMPGQPMRGAAEFIELAANDEEIRAKLEGFRSFRALSSFAEGLGFRFSENEFNDAGRAYEEARKRATDIDAQNAEKLQKSEAEKESKEKKGKGKKGEKAAAKADAEDGDDDELPESLPEEESGEWPEPTAQHSRPYLRRMADAYGVKYDPNATKAELIKAIRKAMFDE